MSNQKLIEKFFSQEKTHGSYQNIFFEDDKLYSYGYHFCIGTLFEAGSRRVFFMQESDYSSTTARHKRYARDEARARGYEVLPSLDGEIPKLEQVQKKLESLHEELKKKRPGMRPALMLARRIASWCKTLEIVTALESSSGLSRELEALSQKITQEKSQIVPLA